MPVAKEQIRQIISENNINSVADVYTLLKDSFKDILQELIEAEMNAALGYEKNQKGNLPTDNKRNFLLRTYNIGLLIFSIHNINIYFILAIRNPEIIL